MLVPGQVMSVEILDYLLALDVKEIHGLDDKLGVRVFTDAVLAGPAGSERAPRRQRPPQLGAGDAAATKSPTREAASDQ